MAKRKPISKKLRFEVFKRDSFTCQYCGKSAPDVVLHVDHIKPVKEGGTNDIMNLITSCADCNLGKGARKLSDTSEVAKAKKQLDEINAKREQLEMMVKWKQELSKIGDKQIDIITDRFHELASYTINDNGRKKIKSWIKKYPISELYDCVELACDKYLENTGDNIKQESAEKAFDYIPKIAYWRKQEKENPLLSDLYYIRGILKNRIYFNKANYYKVVDVMQEYIEVDGVSVDDIKDLAKQVHSYNRFIEGLNELAGYTNDDE
jgi:hypothetical protein